MMKRVGFGKMSVTVTLLLALLLSACGNGGSSSAPGQSSLPPIAAPPPSVPATSAIAAESMPSVDDVFMARFLYSEWYLEPNEEYALDKTKEGRDEFLPVTKEKMADLTAAGVLPDELQEKVLPYLARDTVNYSRHSDGESYNCRGCNFGMGTQPPFYVAVFYTLETGQVYRISASLPFVIEISDEERDAMALRLVAYTGLDAFTDWQREPPPEEETSQAGPRVTYASVFLSEASGLSASVFWHDYEPDSMTFSIAVDRQDYPVEIDA